MKFEFYVLNYDTNTRKIVYYNVFQNSNVSQFTEKALRSYIRAPSKYSFFRTRDVEDPVMVYGFDALCEEIRSIIMWQEWARAEYEISVGAPFETDCNNLTKVDCFYQIVPNIRAITHEVLRQFKEKVKNECRR